MNKKIRIYVLNLKPKEVIQANKILKSKRRTKLTHNLNNKGRIIASGKAIKLGPRGFLKTIDSFM